MEVVTPAPQAAPRIPASEDLGALALFHSYAATVGMSQPALDAALELLRVGPLRRCLPSYCRCCLHDYQRALQMEHVSHVQDAMLGVEKCAQLQTSQ